MNPMSPTKIDGGTIVLGGGPVGLSIAAILKAPVVTDMVISPKGPVYLYDTPSTRKLLDDVKHPSPKPSTISIGYHFKGETSSKPSDEALSEYSYKVKKEFVYHPKPFQYIPVNWPSMMISCRRFIPRTNIDRIQHIDLENHQLIGSRGIVYHYDRLVSTIPAPVFAHLTGDNWHLHYLPVVSKEMSIMMVPGYKEWRKFDYVYICDGNDQRYRWTRTSNERMGIIEKIISPGSDDRPNQYKITGGHVPSIESVDFFGRFARWEEDRFIHDDIKDIYSEVYH